MLEELSKAGNPTDCIKSGSNVSFEEVTYPLFPTVQSGAENQALAQMSWSS